MKFLVKPIVKPLADTCTFAPDCNCFTNCGKHVDCVTPNGNKYSPMRVEKDK